MTIKAFHFLGRCSVGVAEVNGKVFVVGGYDRGQCLNLVECYDQEKNEWVPTTSLSNARGRLGLCCLNGRSSKSLQSLEKYS